MLKSELEKMVKEQSTINGSLSKLVAELKQSIALKDKTIDGDKRHIRHANQTIAAQKKTIHDLKVQNKTLLNKINDRKGRKHSA